MLTKLLQSVFFRGLKVPPKGDWVRLLAEKGDVAPVSVERGGKKLACLRITSGSSVTRPTVVLAHPITRKAKYYFADHLSLVTYLEAGLDVIVFDFNGFGESASNDLFYWKDAEAVIQATRTDRPMLLHGLSFGAFHMMRATQALPTGSVVIMENVISTLTAYWEKWLATRLALKALKFARVRAVQEMEVLDAISTVTRTDLHFHLLACDPDEYAPLGAMKEIVERLDRPCTFEVFQGVRHLEAPAEEPERYVKTLKAAVATLPL